MASGMLYENLEKPAQQIVANMPPQHPGNAATEGLAIQFSLAISVKRIADMMEAWAKAK